jgi:hypothetical protein
MFTKHVDGWLSFILVRCGEEKTIEARLNPKKVV